MSVLSLSAIARAPARSVSGSSAQNSSPPNRQGMSAPRREDPDHRADFAQEPVARQVPELVVDLLEPVQVEHQHGERRAVAARALVLLAQPLREVIAMEQTRELVHRRELVVPRVFQGDRRLLGDRGEQLGLPLPIGIRAERLDAEDADHLLLDEERHGEDRAHLRLDDDRIDLAEPRIRGGVRDHQRALALDHPGGDPPAERERQRTGRRFARHRVGDAQLARLPVEARDPEEVGLKDLAALPPQRLEHAARVEARGDLAADRIQHRQLGDAPLELRVRQAQRLLGSTEVAEQEAQVQAHAGEEHESGQVRLAGQQECEQAPERNRDGLEREDPEKEVPAYSPAGSPRTALHAEARTRFTRFIARKTTHAARSVRPRRSRPPSPAPAATLRAGKDPRGAERNVTVPPAAAVIAVASATFAPATARSEAGEAAAPRAGASRRERLWPPPRARPGNEGRARRRGSRRAPGRPCRSRWERRKGRRRGPRRDQRRQFRKASRERPCSVGQPPGQGEGQRPGGQRRRDENGRLAGFHGRLQYSDL